MAFAVPSKVNIRTIADLYSELVIYCQNNTRIDIDLDGCEDIDLSLLQLIESARKTAKSGQREIALTAPANQAVRSTLHRAGLATAFSPGDKKFWFHEEVV